jgi:putative FmdB family regulatory protein
MPIYEYVCVKCKDKQEIITHTHDAPETVPCQQCGGTAERIISLSNFQLKGGGWAKDGYQKGTKTTPASS